MKVQIVGYDDLDIIKSNLEDWIEVFRESSSKQLQEKLEKELFYNTKFPEIPDFDLDMSKEKPSDTEFENVKCIYTNLKFLTDSQASDERLWAGLCLGRFWRFVKYRWEIDKKCTVKNIKDHFFFGYGSRRSLIRNAISRLWWIGRLTYDESRNNPWEITEFVCEKADNVMHIIERNTANNPDIIKPFVRAMIDARKKGILINTDTVGELAKYLNLLGGIYVLDCLPEQQIYNKIIAKAEEINKSRKKTN